MYQLKFPHQNNILLNPNRNSVQGIYPIQLKSSDDIVVCVRQERSISGYKFIPHNSSWIYQWNEIVFEKEGNYPLDEYPWLVTNKLLPDRDVIILKHPEGIRFYVPNLEKPGLNLLKEDSHFHNVYGNRVLYGSFYPDLNELGVMTSNANGEVKFFVISNDSLWPNATYPVFPTIIDVSKTKSWKLHESNLSLSKVSQEQDVFILRNINGLEIYKFNNDYNLDRILYNSNMRKGNETILDQIHFANLTKQHYLDLLHFNTSGLHIYQYNSNESNYVLIHKNAAEEIRKYMESIKIADINNDGKDEIIYTGYNGLKALSFETNNTWKTMMNADQLPGTQKFSNVVGILPPLPPKISYSSLFMQDIKGNIQWANIISDDETKTTSFIYSSGIPLNVVTSYNDIPERQNVIYPKQIPRSTLSEKPTLRWSEQWDDSFLKKAVDAGSGHVRFSVPLVDLTASTGWGLKLALLYNSDEKIANQLGTGWSMSITSDYIYVDHQRSIYPEDAQYYLMIQGQPQILKLLSTGGNTRSYQVADYQNDKISVKYNMLEETWIIENDAEQTIYGKAKHPLAEDILQWSLEWPNWRGSGTNRTQQQPVIQAWFINTRLDKTKNNLLYYYYETEKSNLLNGKSYTSAIRLKAIKGNQLTKIIFTYALKNDFEVEYTIDPVDPQGNIMFPVPLLEKHYLQDILITTSSNQQIFLLRYEVNKQKRLLKSILQEIGSNSESLLQFDYKLFLDEQVLVRCKTSRLTISFDYKLTVPVFPSYGEQYYRIHKKPKISYGPDYAIMAYLNITNKQIIFCVMSRDLIKSDVDITLDVPDYFTIEDFKLFSYNNSFSVLVSTNEKQILYFYTRQDKNWSIQHKIYNFNKNSLPYFGESIIAFCEKDVKILNIIEYNEKEFIWTESSIILSSPIIYFAMHNKLLTGYDNNNLWLFYKDKNSIWQKNILKSNLDRPDKIVDRFELDEETKYQWIQGIKQSSLQIYNNLIVFSSMQELNERIYSHLHTFLLNANSNIAKYRYFVEERENLKTLSEDFKHESSTYTLKYSNKNNKIKLNIIAASGDVVKDVNGIRNRNRKQDAMEERIKLLNEAEGWQSFLKKKMLLNWKLYRIQINHQGISCGDDILFRFTGIDWNKEKLKLEQFQPLGKYFILESISHDKISLKLYKQDKIKQKEGEALMQIDVSESGAFVNKYPFYIAYQKTPNKIVVVTFKNGKTLDKTFIYENEELLPESDWKNILSLRNVSTSLEFKIIPTSTIISPEKRVFVKKLTLSNGIEERTTGYDRIYNQQKKSFTETTKIIPANNVSVSGWIELTRSYDFKTGNVSKTEDNFDANGKLVSNPSENELSENESNNHKDVSEKNPMILYDRNGKFQICNFSPYTLSSDMVDYYGFESYEEDYINKGIAINKNSTANSWNAKNAKIINNGFTLTGDNYLEINSINNDSSFIEKVFIPHNQNILYIGACWIRSSSTRLDLFTPVNYLKATIKTTEGQKILTMLGQVKHQYGEWYYLELPVDFQTVNQVYEQYLSYMLKTAANSTVTALPPSNAVKFSITLRIESIEKEKIDVDHIRFTPMEFEFEATVYNSITKKQTAVIQSNGMVTKTIYNQFQEEIAILREDGQIGQFTTSTKCGSIFSSINSKIENQNPSYITFEPISGFYETFDTYALRSRWKLENPAAWNIAPGQLWHKVLNKHRLEADLLLFDKTSAAIRFIFALDSSQASLVLKWQKAGQINIKREGQNSSITLQNNDSINYLPTNGEIVIMLEGNYIWLWFNGVLLIEQLIKPEVTIEQPWSSFAMEFYGKVLVEELFIMNQPSVQVEYFNSFGDKSQVLQLENEHSVLVTETLYDEIGREAIVTKTTRINRRGTEQLLKEHKNFVSNKNHANQKSVWRTGKLEGEVDQLNANDFGFAYRRTEFEQNPLNEEKTLGLPGSDFTITGKYATKKTQDSGIPFLSNLFPSKQGFRQKVVDAPNGTKKVIVFDKFKNQIAQYIRVPGYNHLLSTYEYDSENRLVKILPPLYHEKVNTAIQLTPWQAGEKHLTIQEKQWQYLLSTKFIYNDNGNLIRKITPDTGTTEYIYNSMGQMRFMVSLSSNNNTEQIVFYDYDAQGQLIRSGYISMPLPLSTLREHLESQDLPYSEDYQQFDYSDNHPNPIKRGRVKQFITYNSDGPVIEKVQFNIQQQIEEKDMILDRNDIDKFTKIKKVYNGNKLSILTYPPMENDQHLKLFHRYNKLGQLISIDTLDYSPLINFKYNANGQIESEYHHLNNFTRNYRYNSPGFLEELSDPFLTEHLSYTENGYGHAGYGDGMIMQTTFNATWPSNADGRWFQLKEKEIGAVCLRALKHTGHISNNNQPLKIYLRDMETKIPLECDGKIGNNIAKLIAERIMPQYYGYRYAYGNHQELVKAKYFSDKAEEFVGPLQPDTFTKEISDINHEQSLHIWKLLNENNFITTDNQRNDPNVSVGLREKSIFRDQSLWDDLKKLNNNFILFVEPIKQLILKTIANRHILTIEEFEDILLSWEGNDYTSNLMETNMKRRKAKRIGNMLFSKGYFGTNTLSMSHYLDQKFTSALKEYTNYIPEIIQILLVHFAHAVGTTAFDVESYKIDANGNHKLFWTGFNRYELSYVNNTNKIENVILKSFDIHSSLQPNQNLPMKHDVLGNVIHASHRSIEKIEYHPVSQRTTLIKLMDNRTIKFLYDAQGERVLKQVFSSDGNLSYERQYLRDEKGRVIADRVIKYFSGETNQVVTGYLYGPRGLLGFIRNKKFYSVTTDHIGSIRLVIRDGQVVAAYDYLPYGQLMRSFGIDPDAQIVYRYTGQEWDEETNLYNFHARLYDPIIGRFYQPDPKSQYFSPYKYAGNSPVALIDPDGEFAFIFLFAALFAIGGAYLGGAAANNRWNPKDWDFSDPGTYLGIGGGALAGFFLPIGAVASAGTIGIGATILLGTGSGYLMTAAANQNWNPAKWKWDQPGTWNALFQGFGAGSGLAGGVGMAHNFANKIFAANKLGKVLFLGASYTAGIGMTYGAGVMANDGQFAFWKWDWTNPSTWASLVDGFDSGMGWPQGFLEIGRGLNKIAKNPKFLNNLLGKNALKWKKIKAILKNPEHPLYKLTGGLVMTYFMGSSANGEFDVTRWNLASFSTYEGVINGVFSGKDSISMIKFSRQTKLKQPKFKKNKLKKNENLYYTKNIMRQLDNIHLMRKKLEYARLMENFFSDGSKLKSKILKNIKSVNSKKEIENFFKRGEKKWKKTESKTPKELDKLLIKEVDNNVLSSSKDLIEWHQTSDELIHKQNEIFPENNAEFLSCHRGGKVKRGIKRRSCMITPNNRKNEILENYFDFDDHVVNTGFNRINPTIKKTYSNKNYQEKLSYLLDTTPNILVGSKSNFLADFIIGSLLTNPNSGLIHTQRDVYVVKDNMKFLTSSNREFDHSVLKTSFKAEIDGQTWLVLKSYLVEPSHITTQTKKNAEMHRENFLEQLDTTFKYDKLEIDALVKKMDIKGDYLVKEEMYYLDKTNKLYTNEKILTHLDYKTNPENKINSEFMKIESLFDSNLENHLNMLSNKDISVVKEGIEGVSNDLLQIFNQNKQILQLNKNVPESRFHAFLYGALSMDFKNRYNLDVYVERVAGRGYADVLLLSRKDNKRNKNWNAIPIVIELKSDGTSSKSAVDQAIGTSYHNNLSLRTVAEKALLVGINSKTSKIDVVEAVIPVNKNFIKESIDHIGKKEIIENELQNIYNSISPAAIKTLSSENDHYLSRLLIGELLGTRITEQFVKYYMDGDFKDKLTTYLYKDTDSNEWVMLNVVESSTKNKNDYLFEDVNLEKLKLEIPPGMDIKDFTRIDIKLNNRSNAGWSPDLPKRTDGSVDSSQNNRDKYCLQDIKVEKVQVEDGVNAIKSDKSSYKEMVPTDVNKLFNTEQSTTKPLELSNELLEDANLKNNLIQMKGYINSESDFQSIFQGLLMGNSMTSDGAIIKVFPEANPSVAGRIDLVISKLRKVNNEVFEEHLVIMEFKYAKDAEDAKVKLKEGYEQVLKYKNNLKSFTDLKVYTPLAVVFNKATGDITYRAHPVSDVLHYSDSDSDSSVLTTLKKMKVTRSIRNVDSNDLEKHRVSDKSNPKLYTIKKASSGSTRLQFWPLNLIHKAQSTILSVITALWISAPAKKPIQNSNEEYWTTQQTIFQSKITPSILEMGDNWLQSTDLNSNLTLGILIARKLTGYRPKPPKCILYDDNLDIELSLKATDLVDNFIEMLTVQAEASGLNNYEYSIFDNSTIYFKAIEMVKRKLSIGNIYKIPQQLYVQIVAQNMKYFCTKSSSANYNKFISNVQKSLNKWNLQNLYLEQEMLPSRKCSVDNSKDFIQNYVHLEKQFNSTEQYETNCINNDHNLLQ